MTNEKLTALLQDLAHTDPNLLAKLVKQLLYEDAVDEIERKANQKPKDYDSTAFWAEKS